MGSLGLRCDCCLASRSEASASASGFLDVIDGRLLGSILAFWKTDGLILLIILILILSRRASVFLLSQYRSSLPSSFYCLLAVCCFASLELRSIDR